MIPEAFSMYGCCKVAGEYLTRHYSAYMNTVTVRPFSIYGEKEDPGMFIPTLVRCIKKSEVFLMYDGNHDWVHVDDFAKAILIILKSMPIVNGLTINVGSGINISNREVIETMMLISGGELVVKPMGGGNPLWVANSDKIRTLGWKPRISLYDGLKRVYNAL
jgi:GDP-L-fucose synthase